jgi:hypothetical protein
MSAEPDRVLRGKRQRDDGRGRDSVLDRWELLPIPAWTFRPADRPRAEPQADGDSRPRPDDGSADAGGRHR